MTKPLKWWNANGPPSPTTPMRQLELQVLQDKSTSTNLSCNPYFDLDSENNEFLHKHQLSDGTFVFTKHQSIKDLRRVLKTTTKMNNKKIFPGNSISNKNESLQFAPPSHHKTCPNIINDGFTLITSKSPKRKPLQSINKISTPKSTKNKINKLTILTSSTFSLPTSTSRNSMFTKRYLHKPKRVPKTTSELPIYRDSFPATKALKEFFDTHPIDELTLELARKTYDRCVKHSLGAFVPGHHPDRMSLVELRPELKRERTRIEKEYPKDEAQSLRIKDELVAIAEARKHLPKQLYVHKDFPIKYLVGLTKDQIKAMIHNHYVKDTKEPPSFKMTDKDALMCNFRYEVFLLKQDANELNLHANDANNDTPIDYEYTACELNECTRYLPQRLVISPKFPIRSLPALKRSQMEIMLQNHYIGNNVTVPDFSEMNDNTIRSRVHLAINGHLPKVASNQSSTQETHTSATAMSIDTTDNSTNPPSPPNPSPTKRPRNNPELIDVDMTLEQSEPNTDLTQEQPAPITQSQNDTAGENVDTSRSQSNSHEKVDNPVDNKEQDDNYLPEFERGDKELEEHTHKLEAIKTLSNDDIVKMTHDDTVQALFYFASHKYIHFIGDNYRTTPIYLLQRYVQKARAILSGHTNETILNDDETLNSMASLDDDTIYAMENDKVDEFLSTYSRQYNIVVDQNYYSSTSIEQKRIQLIKSLAEYKDRFLKTEPIIHLNEHTTDHMIHSASLNMIKTMLNEYIANSELNIANISFNNLPHVQLVQECKKLRNHIRIEKHLPPLHNDNSNQQDPSAFQKSVANRNGNLFSKFLPKCTTYKSNKIQLANNKEGQLAHRFDQNDFYVRVSVPTKGNDVHIPTVIKLVFGKLRQADPSFTLMPFDRKNKTKNITIAKEDAIPKNKDDLNDWIQGIYITRRNRLLFSMRCTNNVPFKNVRAVLKKWQKDTDIKINFDAVLSQSLFPAGWLKMAHPRILNRDSLFQWINSKNNNDMTHKLHLYPRIMFEYKADGSKALTEVLVIDGAFDSKKDIMDFLLNIKWEGYYSNVSFIPFHVDQKYTKDYQIECIDAHNEFCSNISSEIITIKRPDTVITTNDSKSYRFIDWLATNNTNGLPTFYEVEQIGVTKVLIAYFDRHISTVNIFLQQMYNNFFTEFGGVTTNQVFGDNTFSLTRSAPMHTNSIFKNLANIKKSNPQDNESVIFQAPRVNGFYGQEPVTTSQSDIETFGSKSYSAATQAPVPTENADDLSQLSQLVYDLKEQVELMKTNLTSEVTDVVLTDVDKKLETLETKLNERVNEVESNCDEKINGIASKLDSMNSTMTTNHQILLAAIHGRPLPPPVIPSGDDNSARGGAE